MSEFPNAPAARLVRLDQTSGDADIPLAENRDYVVGRSRACQARVRAAEVSRMHARLVPGADGWQVKDLRSSAGTFVNGRAVETAALRDGDELAFGGVRFRFETAGTAAVPPAAGAAAKARVPMILAAAAALAAVAAGMVLLQPAPAPEPPPVAAAPAAPPPQPAAAPAPAKPKPLARAGYAQLVAFGGGAPEPYLYESADNVLVVLYPDLKSQSRAFNRLYAFVERAEAPRDRVLTDTELTALIKAAGGSAHTFAFGHDYRFDDLARFYTLSRRDSVALTSDESALLGLLTEHGFLAAEAGGYAPTRRGALVSVPRPQTDDPTTLEDESVDEAARRTILRHELSHGIYFTDPAYVDFCRRFWHEVLTAPQRALFRAFLEKSGYDPTNEDLMINEMQAYLGHTFDERVFSAAMLGLPEVDFIALRQRFLDEAPRLPLFEEADERRRG